MRPILLTGATGQLGAVLLSGLRDRIGPGVLAPTRSVLDLTDPLQVDAYLDHFRPGLIVNAAAWTQVDLAERHLDTVMAVNRDAPQRIARWAAANEASLVQVSTDYVFDGRHRRPYRETDTVHPLNVYGRSKAEAEAAILDTGVRCYLVRSSWLLGLQSRGFLPAILKKARQQAHIDVVADRYGSPTTIPWLAQGLLHLVARLQEGTREAPPPGLYHLAAQGAASWWAVARCLLAACQARGMALRCGPDAVRPIRGDAYPSDAVRPAYSCLDSALFCRRFDWTPLSWQAGLAQLLDSSEWRKQGGV